MHVDRIKLQHATAQQIYKQTGQHCVSYFSTPLYISVLAVSDKIPSVCKFYLLIK